MTSLLNPPLLLMPTSMLYNQQSTTYICPVIETPVDVPHLWSSWLQFVYNRGSLPRGNQAAIPVTQSSVVQTRVNMCAHEPYRKTNVFAKLATMNQHYSNWRDQNQTRERGGWFPLWPPRDLKTQATLSLYTHQTTQLFGGLHWQSFLYRRPVINICLFFWSHMWIGFFAEESSLWWVNFKVQWTMGLF